MALSETETIILINAQDLKEGFFRFGTSKHSHFEKLCRRIGGEENLVAVEREGLANNTAYWNCRVPKSYLSQTTFGIKNARDLNRPKPNFGNETND